MNVAELPGRVPTGFTFYGAAEVTNTRMDEQDGQCCRHTRLKSWCASTMLMTGERLSGGFGRMPGRITGFTHPLIWSHVNPCRIFSLDV